MIIYYASFMHITLHEHPEKGKRKIHFQSREGDSPLQELHTDGKETSLLSNA